MTLAPQGSPVLMVADPDLLDLARAVLSLD